MVERGPVKGRPRLPVKARDMDSPRELPRGSDTTWAWLDEQELVQGRQEGLGGRWEALQVESA